MNPKVFFISIVFVVFICLSQSLYSMNNATVNKPRISAIEYLAKKEDEKRKQLIEEHKLRTKQLYHKGFLESKNIKELEEIITIFKQEILKSKDKDAMPRDVEKLKKYIKDLTAKKIDLEENYISSFSSKEKTYEELTKEYGSFNESIFLKSQISRKITQKQKSKIIKRYLAVKKQKEKKIKLKNKELKDKVELLTAKSQEFNRQIERLWVQARSAADTGGYNY